MLENLDENTPKVSELAWGGRDGDDVSLNLRDAGNLAKWEKDLDQGVPERMIR